MKNNWIYDQTLYNVSQWDKTMETRYPEVKKWNKDPKEYFKQVCENCNFLDSIKVLNWNKYLTKQTKVIDLGCGGGWLSSFLSTFDDVDSILAVDTSHNYLYNIMPEVINIMDGNESKISPVEGMFSPLLVEDESVDLVVASAAFHHADNLEYLFKDTRKKIKKGGYLILLNETPPSYFKYINRVSKAFIKLFFKTVTSKYETTSQKISASGFEYDPYLGDRNYPLWYWQEAIRVSGFELEEVIDTKLTTVKNIQSDTLCHFVCKAI